jgi:hypothetical protein
MSDRDPRDKPIPLTGPMQFVPKPTGKWEIYSLARQLPNPKDETHHYLVLVTPTGDIRGEMHGWFTKNFLLWGTRGNYLRVFVAPGNQTMNDRPILGTPTSVYSGSEADVRARWKNAYDTVAKALDKNHTLYSGYPLFNRTYNSNSVWGTALRSIGVKHPQDFKGPLEAPGWETDLRTAPTNNGYVGKPEDSRWTPNRPMDPRFGDAVPRGTPAEQRWAAANPSLSAADAVADAGRSPLGVQAKDWRRRPDDLSSVDLVRVLI